MNGDSDSLMLEQKKKQKESITAKEESKNLENSKQSMEKRSKENDRQNGATTQNIDVRGSPSPFHLVETKEDGLAVMQSYSEVNVDRKVSAVKCVEMECSNYGIVLLVNDAWWFVVHVYYSSVNKDFHLIR